MSKKAIAIFHRNSGGCRLLSFLITPIFLLIAISLSADDFKTLGGDLPKTIKASEGPYLVTADIYVPSGKVVTIESGTVMLFKNFTGIHVEGRLIAQGSRSNPVIFTSEFDQQFVKKSDLHANPYDWNGIYIHEGGIGSDLAFCRIMYSVYGINSQTKFIRIHQGMFANNGRGNLTIEGKQHMVSNEPYSYALSVADAKVDGVPVKILMDPNSKKRNILRYSGLTTLLGGCALGIVFVSQIKSDDERINELSATDVTGSNSPLVQYEKKDFDDAQSKKNRDTGLAIAGFSLAALGCIGFFWSFTF